MKKIVIEEGNNFFRVRLNGVLYANYHDEGYKVLRQFADEHDLIVWILTHGNNPYGDYSVLRVLIEQLREEGYFTNESSEHGETHHQ